LLILMKITFSIHNYKYADNFISSIIMSINIKLYQIFKINNPKIIIL